MIKTGYTSRLVNDSDFGDYSGYLAPDFIEKLDENGFLDKKDVSWYEELQQQDTDWQDIKDFVKVNDILREHSYLEVTFIDDDRIWGNGVILVYNDSADIREIINMGCAYTDGSVCFKADDSYTFKLYEILRNLSYCAIYGLRTIETFRLSSGAKVIYIEAASESG